LAKLLPFLPLFDRPGGTEELDELDEASQPERADAPGVPPDADARREALDTRRSFIVEAPAGSGKTGLLIQRLLKLLADPSVEQPEQVLAITFTLKATAELRDRVLAHLTSAAQASGLDDSLTSFHAETRALALAVLARDRQLRWSLLDRPHRLNIRTIDSVCAQIARTLPVLSGSGGRLKPTTDADFLHREAARRTLLLFGGGDQAFNDALRHLLLHRDGNLANCESLIANMLSVRDQWADLILFGNEELSDAWLDTNLRPRLQLALEHAISSVLTQVEQAFPAEILADLCELMGHLAQADGYREEHSPIAHCAGTHSAPDPVPEDLEHWKALVHLLVTGEGGWRKERGLTGKHLKFEYDRKHHHHSRLTSLIEQLSHREDLLLLFERVSALPPHRYPDDQWAVAKSLFRVLRRALVELQLVFAARNQCDFTELGILARQALDQDSGPEDLAAALGARLQHLLVDEMQDTSTSQYTLLERLTASWDGYSQTVFLVGDPRQSIYLFRQARVERFIRAMRTQRLGDLPLTRLGLTANFRSQLTLVDHFNSDFSAIFPRTTTPAFSTHALPYHEADAILPPSPHAEGRVWHTNPVATSLQSSDTGEPHIATQIRQNQARRNAHEIRCIARQWLCKPLPPDRRRLADGSSEPWRIAVLVRGRNHLIEIVAALKRQDDEGPIPFRAVEIEPLNERQEILDLTALTRALLHPADRVAAFALLRAPWCGLSLADLHTIAGGDEPAFKHRAILRVVAERAHLLPDDSRQRVTRVSEALLAAANQRARLTTAQLVERAWRSLGGDAWLGPSELSNARRFLQLLDAIEAPGNRVDLAVLEERLQRLYSEPDPIPAGTGFVELLTIHNAKGLEWDVVLVPGLERQPAISASRMLAWSEFDSWDSEDAGGGGESGDDRPAHILLAPIRGRGESSRAINVWLRGIERLREAAECKRLFYVASTRAREELHLFAAPDIRSSGSLSAHSASLLKAAWPAAEPHFPHTVLVGLSHEGAPARVDSPEPIVLDLAAAGHRAGSGPTIQRVPLGFDPAFRFAEARAHKLPFVEPNDAPETRHFDRPEGSFAARSFGNAVHAFLDILAARIAAGDNAVQLLAELPSWAPRIDAVLRADGLPPSTVVRYGREARAALANALRDPDGLWLLATHPGAASELALTAWPEPDERTASIRVDRVFRAGPEPRTLPSSTEENYLWIVDYKTASHGRSGLGDFVAEQSAAYAPQLESYARILAPAQSKSLDRVRVALYYPAIPYLIWWKPASS
jgi:ATP-dependent helicase/nuclease subunit A